MVDKFSNLLSWQPLPAGSPATALSLTADDGTWIKLPDFKLHLNVLLVFFKTTSDDATVQFLKDLEVNRGRFEELETAIFGVHTARTDTLRAFRSSIGLQYFLLYDPFAWESRGFRASSRLRPVCKNTTVLIGKDGNVLFSERGYPTVDSLVELIARTDGKDVPAPVVAVAANPTQSDMLRTPGKGPAAVNEIDSQRAMQLLTEKESPFILVDVRNKNEWETGHAPMATLIPIDELPHRYFELNQTTHIIFVCQGGGRSSAASEFMTSIGATEIYNVIGGMNEWTGPRTPGA